MQTQHARFKRICIAFTLRGYNPINEKLISGKQDYLSFEGRPPANTIHIRASFCSCDLDLDPMTFIHKLDLDIMKSHIKNELSRSGLSKVRATAETDTRTDRQTDGKSFPPQTFSFSTGLIPRTIGPFNVLFCSTAGFVCMVF